MGRTIADKIFTSFVVILFGITIVLPLLILIGSSFNTESFNTLIEPGTLKAILNSLVISFFTAFISTVIGVSFAFILTKTDLPLASPAKLLLLLPLFLPPYVFAVAWSDLLATMGAIGLINNNFGIIFILTFTYSPVALFIVSGSLVNIHRSYEEAGEIIGSYPMVIRKIILPLIRPALYSSFSLIFVLSISEFSVPSYLSVPVLATHVFTEFTAFYNYSSTIGQSLILIAICLVVIYRGGNFLSSESVWTMGKKGFQHKIVELKSFSPWLLTCFGYLILSEGLPIGYLITQSISGGLSTLAYAANLLSSELVHSIIISLEGAWLLLIVGYVFAWLSLKSKWRVFDFILLSVFAIPATVIAIALIRFFNTPSLNFVYGSSVIVLIAFLARFVFISQRICLASLRQVPDSYQEAAIVLGATQYVRFIRIQLPLISEGVFNAFCVCFLFCLSEIGASIMVYPPGTSLLPIKVFTLMANSSQGLISAMSVIVLLATLITVAILFLFKRLMFRDSWR